MFNGAPRPRDFIAMCAVIPQEDTLYGALTPRETFAYVARLRLGDGVALVDKVAAAEAMLRRLELTQCADTPVGNEDIRSISGGEKKTHEHWVRTDREPCRAFRGRAHQRPGLQDGPECD